MFPTHKLTISKPCAAALWVPSVATALKRDDFFVCSHPEHKVALQALHLHGARPCDDTRLQATRQGGLRTWRRTPVPANLGNGGGGLQVHRKPEHSSGDGRRGEAGGRALRTCGFAPCSSRLGAVKQCSPMHSRARDCKTQKATIVN